MIIIEAAKLFCGVEIDMDEFADCTKRGERSSTKLYNLRICPWNEGSRIFCCFLCFRGFAEIIAVFLFQRKNFRFNLLVFRLQGN